MNTYRLTLRQRFALHCALTDTARSGATTARNVADRSGMDWDTRQTRADRLRRTVRFLFYAPMVIAGVIVFIRVVYF